MPEIRYVVTYQDGIEVAREPHEVSGEQLYQEQIEQGSNDAIHRIRDNFDNWDSLSATRKREAVKDALCCLLDLFRGRY